MIAKYKKGDAALVFPQPMQREEAQEFAGFFDMIDAYSLRDEEGAVKAVFGFRKSDNVTAEGFALIGEITVIWLRQLLRWLKKFIPQEMQKTGVKTLLVTVKKNFAAGQKFVLLLGFDYAAELPAFYNGVDYQLFERRM